MTFQQYNRRPNEDLKFRDAGNDLVAVAVQGATATTTVLPNKDSKTVTFAAGTTGTAAAHTIFTVTGVVAVTCFAVCTVDVAGSGTIEVGTALNTAGLIAQVAGTALDANEIWHDGTPDASIELDSVLTKKIVSQDIAYLIASNTLSGGTVTFYISWYPISSDGNVVAA